MSDFTKILKVSPLGDGDNWILLEEFKYYDTRILGIENESYWITVPPRFMTDFASVPPIFRSLVSKWGKHGNATVLHDYLYWEQEITKSQTVMNKLQMSEQDLKEHLKDLKKRVFESA